MTYEIIETSNYEGSPVELYTFARDAVTWNFNTSDSDLLISSVNYEAIPISRGKIEQTQDISRSPITITTTNNNDLTSQFIGNSPSDVIDVVIKRFHRNDPDLQVVTIWIGRVRNVKFQGSQALLSCDPIYTALRRPVLRRQFQVNCPHVLYEYPCNADRATFTDTATLSSVATTTLTSPTFGTKPDGYYTGGEVGWLNNTVTDKRLILSHTGSNIVISTSITGLVAGQNVEVSAGCDRTLSTCVNKFSNNLNFGGQPWIPSKNPFTSTTIF